MPSHRARLKSTLPNKASWSGSAPTGEPEGLHPESGAPSTSAASQPSAVSAVSVAPAGRRRAPRTAPSKRRIERRPTAIDVLQSSFVATQRAVFDLRRFLVVLGLTGLALLLPTPPGLSVEGHRAIALFVFTGAILALEPAPLPISALLVPVMQVALGIDTVSGAFAGFGQPALFLVLSSLFLAEALRKHGLTRRLAIYAVVTSGGNTPRLLFNIMAVTCLLSMWVMNTATTAVLLPVAMLVAQYAAVPEHALRLNAVLVMGIAYAASIGGIATIVGSGENAIAAGYLNSIAPFGFVNWMVYGIPVALGLLPISWWLLKRLMHLPHTRLDTRPALREYVRAGPLTSAERKILVVLAVCVVFWVGGSAIEDWLGLPNTLLSSAVVSIVAVAYLSLTEIIDWNDVKGVNWGVFLVIGAGFTLGDALAKTGASQWFADQLAPALQGLPAPVVLVATILLGFAITQFMNNVALGAILTPVLVSLATASGIPPEQLVIPTIMAVALAYMFPGASARMSLVAVTGAVERGEMFRVGLIVGVVSAGVLFVVFYTLNTIGFM